MMRSDQQKMMPEHVTSVKGLCIYIRKCSKQGQGMKLQAETEVMLREFLHGSCFENKCNYIAEKLKGE